MGYGDIGVETKTEYATAIVLMFIGVIFYSHILVGLLDTVSKMINNQAVIDKKIFLLKQVTKALKLPGNVYFQMERVIKKYKEEKQNKEIIPVFNGVNPEDVDDLLYEVFKWELEDIPIFDDVKNEPFWIDFGKSIPSRAGRALRN